MSDEFIVYKHENLVNHKVYIGITMQKVTHRWGKDGNGYKHQRLFARAISKYGWDKFSHEIIASGLTKEDACALEIELIAKYDSSNPDHGYNSSTGGDASSYGFRHSDEAKRKISEAGKLHPPNAKCIRNGRAACIKRVCRYSSNGTFKKEYESITAAAKDISCCDALISNACKGKVKLALGDVYRYAGDPFDKYDIVNRSNEKRKKQVVKLSTDGKVIDTYESASQAARLNGIAQGTLSMCCRGERKTAGGFVWKYKAVSM